MELPNAHYLEGFLWKCLHGACQKFPTYMIQVCSSEQEINLQSRKLAQFYTKFYLENKLFKIYLKWNFIWCDIGPKWQFKKKKKRRFFPNCKIIFRVIHKICVYSEKCPFFKVLWLRMQTGSWMTLPNNIFRLNYTQNKNSACFVHYLWIIKNPEVNIP